MSNGNKYLAKVIIISIVVLINLICIIAVITTVGSTIKDLRKDIESGKVDHQETNQTDQYIEEEPADAEELEEPGVLIKAVMSDSNVRKSFILMVFALILLAIAVVVFIKIK